MMIVFAQSVVPGNRGRLTQCLTHETQLHRERLQPRQLRFRRHWLEGVRRHEGQAGELRSARSEATLILASLGVA